MDTHKKKRKTTRYYDAGDNRQSTAHTEEHDTRPHQTKGDSTQSQGETGSGVTHDLSAMEFGDQRFNKDELKNIGRKGKRQKYRQDPFPGDAPVPRDKIKRYKRGHKLDLNNIKTKFHEDTLEKEEKRYAQASRQAARAELLLQEQAGFLEVDEGDTSHVTQHEIAQSVDVMSAQKFFELKLDKFGPYRINYTRNGRQLVLGGGKGHIAAFDWQTKKLMCEMNVMETVTDVKWLHFETMFAVAQKQWTYIYDNQGIELHCLKVLNEVLRLEFLPYHFLLAASNAKGYLNYIDVSVGQRIAGFPTGLGRLDVMCQNPSNAILHLGHTGGTVSLWSPNVKEPLVKMLCHGGGTRSVAVDHAGQYMATSGVDRTLKIWDLRTYKLLQSYKVGAGAGQLAFSQKGMVAAGMGNVVEVYENCCTQPVSRPYITHRCPSTVNSLQFCPYEDVLGVGHGSGFASLLIPGSGEPNFDALEANPYQTKQQRRQAEVKMLLDKVQSDMIHLDTGMLGKVDTKTLQERMEEKRTILSVKPQKIDFEPRFKKKGKSKTGKREQRKQGVQFEQKREVYKEEVQEKRQRAKEIAESKKQQPGPYNVFARFKSD